MLFVKNMLFCSSAISTHARDVDLFAEIAHIATYFAEQQGETIMRQTGVDPRREKVDLAGMKASMGLTAEVEGITMAELEERRRIIRERMTEHRRSRRRRNKS